MSKKANYFSIGVFVIVASILGALTIIFLGSGKLNKHVAPLLVTFRGSANGLLVGAKVKTYGVQVGTVKQIMLHKEPRTGEIVIPVLIEIDMAHLSNLMGNKDAPELTEEFFDSILKSGACAKLQMESVVTGLLYVELELGVHEHGYILWSDRFAQYHSLPTVPTDMEQMFDTLQQIVDNLGTTDFRGLVDETKGTMTDLRTNLEAIDFPGLSENLNNLMTDSRRMVNNPNLAKAVDEMAVAMESFRMLTGTINESAGGTLQRFNASMDQMQGTLKELEEASIKAKTWLDPSNTIYQEVVTALDQISDASRSLRILIDYVERNPNSFITGKSREEPKP